MVRRGQGTTTVRRTHAVLSGILSDAVEAHRLVTNPARSVENRAAPRANTDTKLRPTFALAAEAGEHRAPVLVLAFCGLRWGEAIALRVANVEFLRRRILVSSNAWTCARIFSMRIWTALPSVSTSRSNLLRTNCGLACQGHLKQLMRWSRLSASIVVELRGFEPLTFSMRTRRATNCAIAPDTGSTRYQSQPAGRKPRGYCPAARGRS